MRAYPTPYSNPSRQCGFGQASCPHVCSIWSIPIQDISFDFVPSRQIRCLRLKPDPPQVCEHVDQSPQQLHLDVSSVPAKEYCDKKFCYNFLILISLSSFFLFLYTLNLALFIVYYPIRSVSTYEILF